MQDYYRIESYLEEIEKRLRPLSSQQLSEEMREVRSHLEQLAEQYEERGMEDAVQQAIRQFGQPADIAGKILRSWRRGQRESFVKATLFAFGLSYIAESLVLNLFSLWTMRGGRYDLPTTLWEMIPLLLPCLGIFIGAGILFGQRFCKNSSERGALAGYVLQRIVSIAMALPLTLAHGIPAWQSALVDNRVLALLAAQFVALPLAGWIGIAIGQRLVSTNRAPENWLEIAIRFFPLWLPLSGLPSFVIYRLHTLDPAPLIPTTAIYGITAACGLLAAMVSGAVASRSTRRNIAWNIFRIVLIYLALLFLPAEFMRLRYAAGAQLIPAPTQFGSYGFYMFYRIGLMLLSASFAALGSTLTWRRQSRGSALPA